MAGQYRCKHTVGLWAVPVWVYSDCGKYRCEYTVTVGSTGVSIQWLWAAQVWVYCDRGECICEYTVTGQYRWMHTVTVGSTGVSIQWPWEVQVYVYTDCRQYMCTYTLTVGSAGVSVQKWQSFICRHVPQLISGRDRGTHSVSQVDVIRQLVQHCGYYIIIPQFTSIGETETQAEIFYNLPTVRDRNIHGVSHVDITIQESRIFMRPMGTELWLLSKMWVSHIPQFISSRYREPFIDFSYIPQFTVTHSVSLSSQLISSRYRQSLTVFHLLHCSSVVAPDSHSQCFIYSTVHQ